MGIFDIFKSDKNESKERRISSPFDLFSIDLNSIPNDSFKITEEGETEEGVQFKKYRKTLNSKEQGLFDVLEVVDFENGSKNFIFSGQQFHGQDINHAKNLVNKLHGYYGVDDMDEGKFNSNDQADLQDGFWTGRMWNSEPHEPHLMLSGDLEEGWTLTIWTK